MPFLPSPPAAVSRGYRVAPARLKQNAQQLTAHADQLERVLSALVATSVPTAAFGGIPQSGQAAAALVQHRQHLGRELDAENTRARDLAVKVADCAAGYETADDAVAAQYRKLAGAAVTSAGARADSPAVPTGPFARQIRDNRRKIATALDRERERLADLLRRQAGYDKRSPWDRYFDDGAGAALDREITAAEHRIALYEDILAGNRQIVVFDPSGRGRLVEQFGTIGPNTQHVGVLVAGMQSGTDNHEWYAHTARSMVNADPDHDLALLVYTDGRNPRDLDFAGAGSAAHAKTMAPDLAAFSHDLRGASPGARISYLGYSYGASTLGAAEVAGLDGDQFVRVEGAGMGPGIWSAADLPDGGRRPHFSMTAPDDPINYLQADSPAFPLGPAVKDALGVPPQAGWPYQSPHGADPDTFPRTVTIDPGYVPHKPWLPGLDRNQHTAVLKPYSPSWWNLFNVITEHPVKPAP